MASASVCGCLVRVFGLDVGALTGLFRQHMVVKGQNRDTAWFAMTDKDWQIVKPAYLNWLSPDNFDSGGTQRRRLEQLYHYPPADDPMTPAGG